MAQQSNLRERLLAALPQPENLAAYREETAALLARHARALRWEKITATTFAFLAVALTLLWNHGPWRPGTSALHWLQAISAILFFLGTIYRLRYEIYDSQIGTLKEIKQVQLQILELQSSLRKDS
jgi:p-aminobenzoyl-glutamate transporter AbgT